MVSRSRRQRAAIWVAAVSVLGLVSAGCSSGDDTGSTATSGASGGSGAQTGAAGAVDITLQEYAIIPGAASVPAGSVTFNVTNAGPDEAHEFVVIKTNKPAGNLLKGKEANETGAVGELDGVKAGNARVLALNLTRGHFALICNLPGHYKTGQFADFYVR